MLGRRPDLAAFQQREERHAAQLRSLAPQHRTRPSLLAPALRAGFWALGAVAAVAPRPLSAAVAAGLQDALTDVCNEQLREMREGGLAEAAPEVCSPAGVAALAACPSKPAVRGPGRLAGEQHCKLFAVILACAGAAGGEGHAG